MPLYPGITDDVSTIVDADSDPVTSTRPPPKATAAAKTLVTGLLDALKRAQEEAVAAGTIEYADTYNIILDPLLADARVVPPGSVDLKNVPMSANQTAQQQLDERTQAVDKNSRKFSILAGTTIVQFLDQVVRNTTYIYDQQTRYYDPKTKQLRDNGTPANVTGWYRIGMQAVPQGSNRYDRKRNDYAYDITYRVEVYGINDARSDFFPSAKYRGTHKRYDYWFTGVNTQVLDFQQDFNYLYYIVQNGKSQPRTRSTTNHREVPRYFFQPRSEQTDQMNDGAVGEPGAQLADYLYSPGDTSKVKLKILGDPAWIQQGDVRGGLPKLDQLYEAFLPDGTISYAGQQVLFEILWNKPVDYNLSNGLMDPGTKNYGSDRMAGQAGDAVQSHVYLATRCTSTFTGGQFTQELEGSQIYFDLPQDQQKRQQSRTDVNQTMQDSASGRTPGISLLPDGVSTRSLGLRLPAGDNVVPRFRSSPAVGSVTLADTTPSPADAAGEPTSFTQAVGRARESQSALRLLGGATGPAVGAPTATLYLTDGDQVQVDSADQVNNYTDQSTAAARTLALTRLQQAQELANSPVTSRFAQIIAKER